MIDASSQSVVEAVFRDRKSVSRAVQALLEKSVPTDAIRVFVLDEGGRRGREIEVEDEPGTMRGALGGALVGAIVGLVVALATRAGMLGSTDVSPLGLTRLTGAIAATLTGAAAGVPIGALLGMGHWRARSLAAPPGAGANGALVRVESEELAGLAESVLRREGPERLDVR